MRGRYGGIKEIKTQMIVGDFVSCVVAAITMESEGDEVVDSISNASNLI